jgi:hypothetical protein
MVWESLAIGVKTIRYDAELAGRPTPRLSRRRRVLEEVSTGLAPHSGEVVWVRHRAESSPMMSGNVATTRGAHARPGRRAPASASGMASSSARQTLSRQHRGLVTAAWGRSPCHLHALCFAPAHARVAVLCDKGQGSQGASVSIWGRVPCP